MNARFVTLTPKPGQAEDLAMFWDEAVVAQITAQPGNRGFLLLTDAAEDRVIAVSLWDSGTDADAAGSTFRDHMGQIAHYLAAPPSPSAMRVAVATQTVLTA